MTRAADGVRRPCSRCGHPCETARFDLPETYGPRLPALARERDTDAIVCDYCAAREARDTLARGERSHACYLSADGRYLTTWGGSVVAIVRATWEAAAGFCGMQTYHDAYVVGTVGPDRVNVTGRGPGRGMYASTRARARV